MKQLLSNAWHWNAKGLVHLLCLDIIAGLIGSISIVMLIPMLDLLNISSGEGKFAGLLVPFAAMQYMQRAMVLIGIFVLLILVRAILSRHVTIQKNYFFSGYEKYMRDRLYDAIAKADWEVLSTKKHTVLSDLIINQVLRSSSGLQQIVSLIASVVTAATQLAIACWMSLPLTVMVLVVGLAFLRLFRSFRAKSRLYGEKMVEINRSLYREIHNQLNGIKETRAYGVEAEQAEVFHSLNAQCYDTKMHLVQLRVRPQFYYSVGAAVMIALAFIVNVVFLDTGTAQLVVLVYIFSRLWPIFSSWQAQLQSIQSALPANEKVMEALEELKQAHQPTNDACEQLPFCHQVEFQNVNFAYKDGNEDVLQDVSFCLPFGSITALVGRSGAGKSTTADLLLGLLRPTGGQILIDGVPLTEENLSGWRRAIGYVPQEPLILDASIRENLQRFHPQATEEDMICALKTAQAWPFVEKLEMGLDTVLGTKGLGLSGGERQRIVLARVLMGNPRLIILDEATSALDYENETMIRDAIRSLSGKMTVLVIAHRLATIKVADSAVVLEDGLVSQKGALEQLLNGDEGYLARMVSVE